MRDFPSIPSFLATAAAPDKMSLRGGAAAHTVVKKSARTLRDDAFACRKKKQPRQMQQQDTDMGYGYGLWDMHSKAGRKGVAVGVGVGDQVPPVGQITRTIC